MTSPLLVSKVSRETDIRTFAKQAAWRDEVRLRGTVYDAFKMTPQARGMTPFAFCDMKTDGAGNVLDMPLRVPDCFGDIVSRRRWMKILPLKTKRNSKKPWLSVEIYARCVTCKAAQGCDALNRERVNSDLEVKARFDYWQKYEATPGKLIFKEHWKIFVSTVASRWRWSTMEAERLAFVDAVRAKTAVARRDRNTAQKRVARAARRPAAVDPLSYSTPSLIDSRDDRCARLMGVIKTRPAPATWKRMTAVDVERISDVWFARELLTLSGTKVTAGKLAPLVSSFCDIDKTGEALRARLTADLKLIAVLETPSGYWS